MVKRWTPLISLKEVTPRGRFAADAPFPMGGVKRMGVIPARWGDGLATSSAKRVLVRGRSCAVVARPSFEHTRVDLSGVPGASVGDEVVLLGRGDEEISLAEVARLHDLDPIQLAPAVREGVARVYLAGDRVVKVRAR